MKIVKNEKGITLIALIITLVVLLILSAVAIETIKNNNIIQYAENARNSYDNKQKEENNIFGTYENFLNNYGGNGTIIPNPDENNNTTDPTPDPDENNNTTDGNTINGNTIGNNTIIHTHNYSIKNTSSIYKATDATCQQVATYYYSCSCGASGTNKFESGSLRKSFIFIR